MWVDFLAVGATVFLGELAAHWFRWDRLAGRKLHPTANYIIGTLIFSTPYAVWLILRRDWLHLAMYGTAVICAGAAVLAGYGIDAYLDARDRARDYQSQMDLVNGQDER